MVIDVDDFDNKTVVKVVGVGGSGISAINCMLDAGMQDIEFIAVDTDKNALSQSLSSVCIPLTRKFDGELGSVVDADSDSVISARGAEEQREEILGALDNADMVFIVAGMGGGTTTSAVPIVAKCAKEVGALTVAIVTRPFSYEGRKCFKYAEVGIEKLRQHVDTIITISNDRVLETLDKSTSSTDVFKEVDSIICQGVQSISDFVSDYSYVNLDFDDIKTAISNAGSAFICMGEASGDNAPEVALSNAVNSVLLEKPICGARSIVISFSGAPHHLNMMELYEATQSIVSQVHPEANILWGVSVNDTLEETIRVIAITTNFESM